MIDIDLLRVVSDKIKEMDRAVMANSIEGLEYFTPYGRIYVGALANRSRLYFGERVLCENPAATRTALADAINELYDDFQEAKLIAYCPIAAKKELDAFFTGLN